MARSASLAERIQYRVEYAGFAALRALCARLSLDRGADMTAAVARGLGPLTPLRDRALRNLRIAMPDLAPEQERKILSGMFDNFTRTAVEYLHLAELRDAPDRIAVEGMAHLEAARREGRGAVLVTGHLGNWEVARILCARAGQTPALIYRSFNNPFVDRDGRALMQALGAPVLHKGRKGSLGLLRHLREGGLVMILTDQRFRGAPELPFFGRPATTALAAAELSQRYGAPLLPVRAVRRGRSSAFDVAFEPPIAVGGTTGDAAAAMTRFNALLEGWIRETPEQYFWFHNRWRAPRRKSGAADTNAAPSGGKDH